MGLPLLAVGLFYRRGYFHQLVDSDGAQQHDYPELDAMRLPLLRVAGPDGGTLRVPVEVGERNVSLRVWCAFVGHVPLLLLDSFTTHNPPEDRFITSQLYVRGRDMRLEQEIVLGRGAVELLSALGIRPRTWHMNEGHSAFLALENARRSAWPTSGRDRGRATAACSHARRCRRAARSSPTTRSVRTSSPRPRAEHGRGHAAGPRARALQRLPPGFNLTALALRLSRACSASPSSTARQPRDVAGLRHRRDHQRRARAHLARARDAARARAPPTRIPSGWPAAPAS